MEARTLKFMAEACAGELVGGAPETPVMRVCTDSRQIQRGDLFVALRGERFDGHRFVAEAIKEGAVAALAEKGAVDVAGEGRPRRSEAGTFGVIVVEDTRAALGRLAAEYRKAFRAEIIAVGGSNGKTTTKELVASVLKQKLVTLWSEASFNNAVGVPLTLLRLEKGHEAAVLEVGTNHPGELAPLVKMAGPRLGVITSIGREHLEFFCDLEGVAQEEGWLGELLPLEGVLFLNGDSQWSNWIAERSSARVVRVGTSDASQWRVNRAQQDNEGVTFWATTPNSEWDREYRINLLGRHQAVNALFALAVAAELGLNRAEAERGLNECKPARMRLQLWERNGVRVLDDAYNANADSMVVAIQTLLDLPFKGRRLAVLGDMAEVGRQSEAVHEEIGRRAAELGVGQLFAVGKMAPHLARGARDAGLHRVMEFEDVTSAAAAVKRFVREGDTVLLKASRKTALERVGAVLAEER